MAVDTDVHATEPAPEGYEFPPSPTRRVPRLRHANFNTSWAAEIALLNSSAKQVAAVLGLVAFLLLPFVLPASLVRVITFALLTSIGAIGLTLIAGVAGQLSLGHAAFLGIGAYSAAYVTTDLGWNFFFSLPVAAAAAGIAGLLLAPVSLRLRGLYLAVVTLGFVFVMQHVFRNATFITGGVGGKRIELPEIAGVSLKRGGSVLGLELESGQPFYFVALVACIVTVLVTKNLIRSRTGRDFAAVRDHDIAAGVVGVNVFGAKTRAFVISSAMTGVAGALIGGFIGFTNFDEWGLLVSVEYLLIVIIGGLGSILGAILGAFFVELMPELVDSIGFLFPFLAEPGGTGLTPAKFSVVLYGVIVAAVMVFEPLGLLGVWLRVKTYFRTWPFTR